jgi:hypothetical protein
MMPFVRSIAIIPILLCVLAEVHAEEPLSQSSVFRFGGGLGGGLVDWVGQDANEGLPGTELVPRAGFAAGLVAALDLSAFLPPSAVLLHLSLQPEFFYVTRGATLEIDGEYRATIHMDYLRAGLLLRGEYATAGRAVPYVFLGPELGFLRRAESTNRFDMTANIENNFKSTDFGLILGLGAMYALPPYGSLGLELRGDLGLVSIDGQGDGDEIRNAALTLLLVYLY